MSRMFNKKKKPKHGVSGTYKQRGDTIVGNVNVGFDERWFLSPNQCSKRVSIDYRFAKCMFTDKKLNLGYGTYRYGKYKSVGV